MPENRDSLKRIETRKSYQNELKELIREAEGSQGYLSVSSVKHLITGASELQALAEKYIVEGNDYQAIEISCAILEEMTTALGFTDDCKGDVGNIIERTMALIMKMSDEPLKEETRKYLFEYLISAFRKKSYEGWDWYFGSIGIAINLMQNKKEAEKILSLLEPEVRGQKNRTEARHYMELFKTKLELL